MIILCVQLFINESSGKALKVSPVKLVAYLFYSKNNILKKIDNPLLNSSIKNLLRTFKQELESNYKKVNDKIISGENKGIKLNKKNNKTTWSLPYNKNPNDNNHDFYKKIPSVDIYDLMKFVDEKTKYSSAFKHIKGGKNNGNKNIFIIPAVIANGTGLGIYRMSEISDLSYNVLYSAEKTFLRLETLREANNIVMEKITELPIFKYYNINKVLHASLDGQKHESRRSTLKTRYSSKYFGTKKGVVAMTMMINNVAANSKIIGANEHESHHIFDLIYNNDSCLEPTIVSTDTAGTNQLNFLLLSLINKAFAPRYKNLKNKTERLYGFQTIKNYSNFVVKASIKINENLIIEEWDNIKRILASLLSKKTNQSVLIRQLSSHLKKNKTKLALWELNNILMSNYILQYIDDEQTRKYIQKALNRVEGFHQMRRAISFTNNSKFRGTSDLEIMLWNECSRLIANCMVYYNSVLLSNQLHKNQKEKDLTKEKIIQKISPIAWQHANFIGKFSFINKTNTIQLEKLLKNT